jgi:hypothetical protein
MRPGWRGYVGHAQIGAHPYASRGETNDLGPGPCDNPLRYSAIYIVALTMAVYFGVYFSAVSYDLLYGVLILTALTDQDTSYVARWVVLRFGDYGIPVLGILTLR